MASSGQRAMGSGQQVAWANGVEVAAADAGTEAGAPE